MAPVSLGFLIFIAVIGGAVAYFGDWLGRTIGKKRLNILHLRPKHTAALGTFVFGMIGTALAIVAVSVASQPVRDWILRGQQAEIDLQAKTKDLEGKQRELDAIKESLGNTKGKLDKAGAQLGAKTQELKTASDKVSEAQAKNTKLQSQTVELVTRAKRLQDETKSLQTQLKTVKASLATYEGKIAELQKRQVTLTESNKVISSQNAELSKSNLELTNQTRTLQEDIKQLTADESALRAESSRLKTENAAITSKLDAARANLEDANSKLDFIRSQIATYELEAQKFVQDVRSKHLLLNVSDELARIPVPAHSTAVETRACILSALRDAGQLAAKRGATKAPDGSGVQLVDPDRRTPEAIINAAALALAGKPDQQLLIVRCVLNSFEGEPGGVMLEAHKDPVVYKAGQTVATARIDGRQSEDKIAAQVEAFVEDTLRNKVVKDGLIPALGQDAPLGEITREQILDIVNTLAQASRVVRVDFVAALDTRAGDKLKLEIKYR